MEKTIYICDYCGEEIKKHQREAPRYSGIYIVRKKLSKEEYEAQLFRGFLERNGYEKNFHEGCHEKWMSEMMTKWKKEREVQIKFERLNELKEKVFMEYLESKGLKKDECILEAEI